jgi:hypothetical protein
MHRALVSVNEELEAIDWYQQRMDACGDEDLKGVLQHNLEEEVEHACKGLEWIRRHHPLFDAAMRQYLFGGEKEDGGEPGLGIGALKEDEE